MTFCLYLKNKMLILDGLTRLTAFWVNELMAWFWLVDKNLETQSLVDSF